MKLLFTFSAAFFFFFFVASRNLSPARCFDKKALAAEIFAISCLCHGEGMCGEVRSEPTIPNTASSLSACYVCASYASAVYLQRKRLWLFYLPFKTSLTQRIPRLLESLLNQPVCLSVGETVHDTQREIWEEEQREAVRPLIVPSWRFSGTKYMETHSERGIPPVSSNDCRCAPGPGCYCTHLGQESFPARLVVPVLRAVSSS